MRRLRKRYKILLLLFLVFLTGMLIPESYRIPVSRADHRDWNRNSFWYYPWGRSGTHKGIDIFAERGRDVHSATAGLVLFTGSIERGGKVALVLGPKWKLHYYAHLNTLMARPFTLVNHNSKIGTVGNTGNALGKPPHLHYSIFSLLPRPHLADASVQGWKKMFYLNPDEALRSQ